MSIQILNESYKEHRTAESITITTQLFMNWNDFYNGFGRLFNEEFVYQRIMYLPRIGDSYGNYMNTTYNADLVLSDISMDVTNAETSEQDDEGKSINGWRLHKKIKVTYTWSSTAAEGSDEKKRNEASSWKISFDSSLETIQADIYEDTDDSTYASDGTVTTVVTKEWADVYCTKTNPEIFYKYEEDETPKLTSLGLYNAADAAAKTYYKATYSELIPPLEIKKPTTIAKLRIFGNDVHTLRLSRYLGQVNSADFLPTVYASKEEALLAKQKRPEYNSNDFTDQDDTGKWQYYDWDMSPKGGQMFEYTLYFEYKHDGWNKNFGVDVNRYKTVDIYDVLLDGMDLALPDNRTGM